MTFSDLCQTITKMRPMRSGPTYIDVRPADLTPELLASDDIKIIGELTPGWIMLEVKNWIRKPYKVTRAP